MPGARWSGRGLVGLEDLFPAHFEPEDLAGQIAAHATRTVALQRKEAERIRGESPEASPRELIERLFEPFLRRSVALGVGGAVADALPTGLLHEDATRRQSTRSLLDQQIDLLVLALLVADPRTERDALGPAVVAILDEVYDLDQVATDLQQRSVGDRLRQAGASGAARLVLRKVFAVVEAGRGAAELYRRYSRWQDVRAALLRRIREGRPEA